MTEEDITGKLILPYLNDLGFDVSEISLERGFKIRLGRKKYARGRSDIVIKRNNKNLFVIEVKNPSISITDDHIDQGISYARLLDDIAPFTIITNGKTQRVFDSITKKELLDNNISELSPFWKNGCTLSEDDDLRIRYEALRSFIAFSPENLKLFCNTQVRERMGSIVGSIDSPYSKFVKELHVKRNELQSSFKNFINSDCSIFGLVGNAGVGKTSAICSLALQNLEENFVFFYNTAIITSPMECISQDLNIAFSTRVETDVVLKKLDGLGHFANKEILVFIDAIDESTNSNISQELSDIALVSKNLEKVKIVISCKSNIWNSIIKIKNTPTHLFEELEKSHNKVSSLNNSPAFVLNDFTDEELKGIVPLYQKAFGFKGVISNSLLKELKNGFFLKIFSEVYNGKKIPEKINDKELIKKYLNQSINKTDIDQLNAIRILSKIGAIQLGHKYNSWESYKDEGLDAYNLLEKLDFSLDKKIPEDLYSRNILIKSNKEDSYNISFYYSKIRDFVICYHSYKLDKLSDEEFYNVLSDFYVNHIGKSAIAFYIENASSSHLYTLSKFKKDKALEYVIGYENYILTNFKNFKEKFNPETVGDIGIILPEDLINEDGFALLPVDLVKENRVQHYCLKDPFYGKNGENLYFDRGVISVYSSNNKLLVANQINVIKKDIYEELQKILEKGKLSFYNSDILLLEKVSSILYVYYEKLSYNYEIEDYYLPRFNSIYPIDLKDLKDRLYKFIVTEYFKRKRIDRTQLKKVVEDALLNKIEIPKLNIIGDFPPFEELYRIVNILLDKGYHILKEHHLPCPDLTISETKEFEKLRREKKGKFSIHKIRNFQYSEEQAKLYIDKFFLYLENSYLDFVEHFFPTIKDSFKYYKAIPNEYFFFIKKIDDLKWGGFGYKTSVKGDYKTIFIDREKESEAFKKDKLKFIKAFSLDFIMVINDYSINRYPVQTLDRFNTEEVDKLCVIRNWIYKMLEDDIKDIIKQNTK